MIFTYKCSECNREIATQEFCTLVICMFCDSKMGLLKIGNKKIEDVMVIQ